MRNGRKTRLAAMMIAAAVIAMAGMANAAPRRFDTGDPGASRLPANKARYESLVARRTGTDAARKAFIDAARQSLLRVNLRIL